MRTKVLKKSKNFFFLTEIGFSKRDYERFEIKFLKKHFNVKVFDLTFLNSKKFFRAKEKHTFKFSEYKLVKSYKKFFSEILKYKNETYCFDLLNNNANSFYIRNFLKEKKFIFIMYDTGLLPNFDLNILEKLKKLKIKINKKKILNSLIKSIREKINYKRKIKLKFKYDILLRSGKSSKISANNILNTYSIDYYNFLKTSKRPNKKDFILFIDQNLPDQPGQKIKNKSLNINRQQYYEELNIFFDYLEQKFRKSVIISGHPTSNKNQLKNKFYGRKVIMGKTATLSADCLFMLIHTSTCTSFATLYNKPAIFITFNDLENSYDAFIPKYLAKEVGSNYLNISHLKKKKVYSKLSLKIDKVKYKKYIESYLCHPLAINKKESPFKLLKKYIFEN